MQLVWIEVCYKCKTNTGIQRLSTEKKNVKYAISFVYWLHDNVLDILG